MNGRATYRVVAIVTLRIERKPSRHCSDATPRDIFVPLSATRAPRFLATEGAGMSEIRINVQRATAALASRCEKAICGRILWGHRAPLSTYLLNQQRSKGPWDVFNGWKAVGDRAFVALCHQRSSTGEEVTATKCGTTLRCFRRSSTKSTYCRK